MDRLSIAVYTENDSESLTFISNLAECISRFSDRKVQIVYTWMRYPYFQHITETPVRITELVVNAPKIQLTKCSFCAQCAKSCPYAAIRFNKLEQNASINYEKCMTCSACIKFCRKKAILEHPVLLGKKYFHKINEVHYIGGIPDEEELFYPDYILKNIEKELFPTRITIVPLFKTDDFYSDEVLKDSDIVLIKNSLEKLTEFNLSIIEGESKMKFSYLDKEKEISLYLYENESIEDIAKKIIDKA